MAGSVLAAELIKLRGLPATWLTAAATVIAGFAVAAALGSAPGGPPTLTAVVAGTVAYVQAGLVLLGVLPAGHEYAGLQIHTTLAAVPRRLTLLAAKTLAAGLAGLLTAAATLGAAVVGAWLTLGPGTGVQASRLAGAAAYLTLIGLLSHAVTVLLRRQVPALVTMLSLVMVLSPTLAALTEQARWLPDRAGLRLYDPTDPVLTPTTGALVLLGWIGVSGSIAALRFLRGDAH